MSYVKGSIWFISALILVIWAVPSHAIDPIPKQDGFSGRFAIGANFINFESNEIAEVAGVEVSEKRTNSLSDEPEDKGSGLPSLNFDLRYTFGQSQTQIFLANALWDILKADSYTELGVRQQFSDRSILSAGVVYSGLVKVYQDPYVLGVDRQTTDRTASGARLVYDKIMGSGLELEAMYRKIKIDDEKSGTLGGLGLTASEISLLDREGDEISVGVGYAFSLGAGQVLKPSFTFISSDLDGDAMSNDRYQIEMTYLFDSKDWGFGLNLLFASASYDESNPVFNREQEDTIYGGLAFASYKNIFDVQRLDLIGRIGGAVKDADIDFLNSQVIIAGLSIQYSF